MLGPADHSRFEGLFVVQARPLERGQVLLCRVYDPGAIASCSLKQLFEEVLFL